MCSSRSPTAGCCGCATTRSSAACATCATATWPASSAARGGCAASGAWACRPSAGGGCASSTCGRSCSAVSSGRSSRAAPPDGNGSDPLPSAPGRAGPVGALALDRPPGRRPHRDLDDEAALRQPPQVDLGGEAPLDLADLEDLVVHHDAHGAQGDVLG